MLIIQDKGCRIIVLLYNSRNSQVNKGQTKKLIRYTKNVSNNLVKEEGCICKDIKQYASTVMIKDQKVISFD